MKGVVNPLQRGQEPAPDPALTRYPEEPVARAGERRAPPSAALAGKQGKKRWPPGWIGTHARISLATPRRPHSAAGLARGPFLDPRVTVTESELSRFSTSARCPSLLRNGIGRDPFCVRADAALFRVDAALSLDWNLRCVPCWGSSSRGGLEIDTHTHTHGHGCLTVFHLYAVNFTRTGPIHPGFTCVNS